MRPLKCFLIRSSRTDFWARRELCVCVCARVCACGTCTCMYTHHFPVQKSWPLPYLGRRIGAFTWKGGVSCQKGGWRRAVPEIPKLPRFFHFSLWTLEFPSSFGSCLPPCFLGLDHPFPFWGVLGEAEPSKRPDQGGLSRGWALPSTLALWPLLPPTELPLPQGRVGGTGGRYPPTPHAPAPPDSH